MNYLSIAGIKETQGSSQFEMVFETVTVDDVLNDTYLKSRSKKKLENKNCKCCGGVFTPTHGSQEFCSKECKRKKKSEQALISYHRRKNHEKKIEELELKMGKLSKPTRRCSLCVDCKNVVPNPNKHIGCSWSINFIPVNGWEAIKMNKGNYVSYKVIQCPKFKKG